jgi:pleckstrin homology domain-containing family G member 4
LYINPKLVLTIAPVSLFLLSIISAKKPTQKHIAKGKDLIEASTELDTLMSAGDNLNSELKAYSVRLEALREKIEGAARLHHLLALKLNEDDIQKEMQKLAEKIGLSSLMQNIKSKKAAATTTGKMTITTTTITTSTPKKEREMTCDSSYGDSLLISASMLPSIEESPEKKLENNVAKAKAEVEDNDDSTSSKLVDDSGLGTFVDSFDEMKDGKLLRACSCQSIVDDATLACDNSQHDDDADLDDYDTSENITSISLDEPKSESLSIAPVPLQANAHLYCHASNLQLDLDDNSIDQKTQK